MSETEKFTGKFQLKPRQENETDKEYFERVTGGKWQVYNYEPDSIQEAIYDNNMSYFEAKHGKKGYLTFGKNIYEILEIQNKDIEESYCELEKISDDTFKFEAQFYNGGCSLSEILQDEFERKFKDEN